jgi:anti-sigma regulatory factor (Ser/Thr protein kinase)
MIQPVAQTVCVVARFSSLPQLLATLSTSTVVPDHAQSYLRAQVAVEELFVNTIRHGYGQESDQPVWLTVEQRGAVLRIVYSDQSDAFNTLAPRSTVPDDVEAQLSDPALGGFGLLLVASLASQCQYTREAGRNVTQLEFALAPASKITPPVPVRPRPR